MPKKKVEKVHINVTIDEDLDRWLEKTAVELRMNKSHLINNLILVGKDDVEILKATGLLGLASAVRKVKEEVMRMKNEGIELKIARNVGVVEEDGK
jgi:hypothetical protein